jgi:serine/threonine-protein kinase
MTNAATAAQRSLVGAILSRRFRLTRRLGDGGMGEVYAAEPVEGGATVAIKILLPDFLAETTVLARFVDEARTCMRLIHPNIVRVYECSAAEDGSPYIVMELLEGVPLSAYTQNGGRVPVAQAIPILQGILAGLAAAHAQQIVHRDLKPENVFLTRDAHGQFHVKVLDFGIAKVMDVAGGMGNKTRTGMLLGTPAYMSPEQIKSAKDVDQRADLWSAGVMFYEMLTGRVAFPAPTEYARLSAVLTTTPDPIERIDLQLAPLAPFMQRAMQKDKNLRFQSALEMARALTAASASQDAAAASVVHVQPLSRLPDVPSLFAPSVLQPSTPVAAGPTTAPMAPQTAAAATMGAPVAPPAQHDTMNRIPVKTTGGTLASHSTPMAAHSSDPPPQVVLVPTGGPPPNETLPSKDLPMLPAKGSLAPEPSRGIAPLAVVLLVVGALAAGFLIGFAVGRMM